MKIFSVFVLLFTYAVAPQADNTPDSFSLIIDSLNTCYDTEHKEGTRLGRCVLKKLEKANIHYRVRLDTNSFDRSKPTNVTITIYNKFGDVYTCKAVAQKIIEFKQCTGKKIPELTPAQGISFEPPQ